MPLKQPTLLEMFGNKDQGQDNPRKTGKRPLPSSSSSSQDEPVHEKRICLPPVPISSPTSPVSSSSMAGPASSSHRLSPEEVGQPLADQPVGELWPSPKLAPVFSALLEPVWRSMLEPELKKEYVARICAFLERAYGKGATVFPARAQLFHAFNLTPFDRIRVVLIGQDPYHNWQQAHGLCFSVPRGVPAPPSLKNIFKELSSEYPHFVVPSHGCLESWARQGVFMLNASLTVEAHKANSHSEIGWQLFTDAVIQLISRKSAEGVVFLLWGGFAHRKEALVDKRRHRVIRAAHPSPLSAVKFFGCKCFSRTNASLQELGREPVDWTVL